MAFREKWYTKICLIAFAFCLCLLTSAAIAQSDAVTVPPPLKNTPPPETSSKEGAQDLPTQEISIITNSGKQFSLTAEIARTREQRRIGLMYRPQLLQGKGMLFIFDKPAPRQFWMKNTWIALDMIFINTDGIIHHIHPMAEPNSTKRISSNGNTLAVLELSGGEAERLGINIGSRVMYTDTKQQESNAIE